MRLAMRGRRFVADRERICSPRALAAIVLALAFLGALPARAVYIQGIDVYSGNGTITWSSVKNGGYDFAFVKATEGVNAPDSAFTTNMSGANAAGIYVGPYHFAHTESLSPAGTLKFDNYTGGAFAYNSSLQPNRDAWFDATMEAVDFIKRIRTYYYQTGTTHYLPPVSDIEQAYMPNLSAALKKEFVSNWAQLFSDTVYDALGVRPILYVSKSSANTNFTSTVAVQQPFWIAWYKGTGTTSPPVTGDTPGWPAWSFWQWSDGTDSTAIANPVPGAGTHIDRDVFSGTSAQLAAMKVQLVQGDYNHNTNVDAGDYVAWRKRMSLAPTAKYDAYSVAFLGADGNLSNKVDAADYTYWRSKFGNALSGSGSGAGLDSLGGVPEPSSVAILFCGLLISLFRRVSH
jgi:GH25 family lysozyme M1 (1,4-beta-N-acetylmuramidase)